MATVLSQASGACRHDTLGARWNICSRRAVGMGSVFFRQVADQPPDTICRHMAQKGEEWAGDMPQEDDITFVVFKIR